MKRGDYSVPPVVARSGRSFDFAGYRIRLEGSAHDTEDRVPEIVQYIVGAIEQRLLNDCAAGGAQ